MLKILRFCIGRQAVSAALLFHDRELVLSELRQTPRTHLSNNRFIPYFVICLLNAPSVTHFRLLLNEEGLLQLLRELVFDINIVITLVLRPVKAAAEHAHLHAAESTFKSKEEAFLFYLQRKRLPLSDLVSTLDLDKGAKLRVTVLQVDLVVLQKNSRLLS